MRFLYACFSIYQGVMSVYGWIIGWIARANNSGFLKPANIDTTSPLQRKQTIIEEGMRARDFLNPIRSLTRVKYNTVFTFFKLLIFLLVITSQMIPSTSCLTGDE